MSELLRRNFFWHGTVFTPPNSLIALKIKIKKKEKCGSPKQDENFVKFYTKFMQNVLPNLCKKNLCKMLHKFMRNVTQNICKMMHKIYATKFMQNVSQNLNEM